MKIKKYLSIILFLFISNLVYSNPVDSTLAKEIAINYYNFLKPGAKDLKVSKVNVKNYKGIITRYTFVFSVKIETQDLKSGIYILRIISKSKVETLQIIKQ
ncbi:MAG TPA: hypothetical protein DHW83_03320 [Bacteroidales bacterium]|nr:hypothetical protein [Bacteroidales bacterium]